MALIRSQMGGEAGAATTGQRAIGGNSAEGGRRKTFSVVQRGPENRDCEVGQVRGAFVEL